MPAKPWTSVTFDDSLVSNLVSVLLTWSHESYQWMDQELFLKAMCEGNTKSPCCSSFLVNAMLCCACPYSDYQEARTKMAKMSNLWYSFSEEAERLLQDIDESQASLATAQGLSYLFPAYCSAGQASLGYQAMNRAIAMCQRFEERYASVLNDSSIASEHQGTFEKAVDTTPWGIFDIATRAWLAFRKVPPIHPSERKLPISKLAIATWTTYPLTILLWFYIQQWALVRATTPRI